MKDKILDNLPEIFVILAFIFGITLSFNHAKAGPEGMSQYPWVPMQVPMWCGPIEEVNMVLEKEGYVTVKEMITLSNTKDSVERNYKMNLFPSTLTFSVEPKGGQLILNGRQIEPSGSYQVDSKTEHAITYILEGFYPVVRNVSLKKGEKKLINNIHVYVKFGPRPKKYEK